MKTEHPVFECCSSCHQSYIKQEHACLLENTFCYLQLLHVSVSKEQAEPVTKKKAGTVDSLKLLFECFHWVSATQACMCIQPVVNPLFTLCILQSPPFHWLALQSRPPATSVGTWSSGHQQACVGEWPRWVWWRVKG